VLPLTQWLLLQTSNGHKIYNTTTMPSHKVSSHISIKPQQALHIPLHILSTKSPLFFRHLPNLALQCRLLQWAPHHLFRNSTSRGTHWDSVSLLAMTTQGW